MSYLVVQRLPLVPPPHFYPQPLPCTDPRGYTRSRDLKEVQWHTFCCQPLDMYKTLEQSAGRTKILTNTCKISPWMMFNQVLPSAYWLLTFIDHQQSNTWSRVVPLETCRGSVIYLWSLEVILPPQIGNDVTTRRLSRHHDVKRGGA